jgi:hypothetical protein
MDEGTYKDANDRARVEADVDRWRVRRCLEDVVVGDEVAFVCAYLSVG